MSQHDYIGGQKQGDKDTQGIINPETAKETLMHYEEVYTEEIISARTLPLIGPYNNQDHTDYMNGWINQVRKNLKI